MEDSRRGSEFPSGRRGSTPSTRPKLSISTDGADPKAATSDFAAAAPAALDSLDPSPPGTGSGKASPGDGDRPTWLETDPPRPDISAAPPLVERPPTGLERPGTVERSRRRMLAAENSPTTDWREKAYSPSGPIATARSNESSERSTDRAEGATAEQSAQQPLPHGAALQVVICSNWGDSGAVGLAGLELFDGNGMPITFSNPEQQVRAPACSTLHALEDLHAAPPLHALEYPPAHCTHSSTLHVEPLLLLLRCLYNEPSERCPSLLRLAQTVARALLHAIS